MSHDSVLTLDGVTPKSLGMGVFRRTQRPILSSTVDTIVTVPGMHGAYDFGATMGPKQFELECAFFSKNHIELQQRVSALAAFLLDGDGRPRTMPIIFANQPDRQYMVRYLGDLQIDRISGLGTFTLPFTAFDPFAYSTYWSHEINVDSLVFVDSDIYVDTAYEFSINGPQTIPTYNTGNQNAQPIIEINGAFSYLSLMVGGVEFIYTVPMSGTLTLDFQRKTARIGTQNVLQNTNARFGKLPVGISNIQVDGTGLNFNMTIKFRQKYA
ncbi:distal tail protein Dit [Paenibacillus sp. BR1-192]|uniref:distal tail protein Dit n=1 Tax=Paenibacillus sp. BR1-192 TaxID=3032287 RepID=UPI00240D9775|nr:distal tail protein Dit [Paenibacillus sp. BR1-192]WFB57469.1 phage tail family protein [Paenibacillus sp. BR1-192]